MKALRLFKNQDLVVVEVNGSFQVVKNWTWDDLFTKDDAFNRITMHIDRGQYEIWEDFNKDFIEPPINSQELWASGVTYLRSKEGREEESQASGGASFYDKVYYAERPELFFKATKHRIVGHGYAVRIRKDSTWNVPEPELTLAINKDGHIIGYTIGNDMSSRSIEGENPLYLPQAKTYDGSAALGPCLLLTNTALNPMSLIMLQIMRSSILVFEDQISIDQMKRKHHELVEYLFRECSFPFGVLLMTGTGIVPSQDFTLEIGDEINISIDGIGVLMNTVSN
ncbi:fumarylacetoacetate hydrolase family protein [Portibacter marinus]|uniref:fumarylacetoacetate hydrolase family protein n=1 Tax=Portibacter marinus TaxID=2898660 RepID=UPI001F358563|nr:fumarylacetoacetate hydrolase family protein [Portibacter marinus]